jgi:hypothetical protein
VGAARSRALGGGLLFHLARDLAARGVIAATSASVWWRVVVFRRRAENFLSAGEAGVDVAWSEQTVVTDLEELVREDVPELCGGADYVARPSAISVLPQR